MKNLPLSIIATACLAMVSLSPAAQPNRHYRVEEIPTPAGIEPTCGGLSFLPDGRLVAVFDQGQVSIYNPATKTWRQFAEGLHTPMGVLAISEKEIVVTQRAELTRLLDTNGDGVADEYICISDAWGLSGNYHEFAFGLARDRAGNFYVPLGSASGGGVSRHEVRGENKGAGATPGTGHYSPTPYRGWVVRISPEGKLTPIACGFRQPNGIAIAPDGRLFVTDNQGDWVGTSKIHHVVEGGFYGQPAGLAWRADFRPGRSVLELDQMRTEAIALLPHAVLANSPAQPAFDVSDGRFGPFAGQMFVPDYTTARILRVMFDEVDGEVQSAVTPFFDGAPLRLANNRIAFAPDGSLWCGQAERKLGWPGAAGIQRIVWNGSTPMAVETMKLTARGFEFRFTKAIDRDALRRSPVFKAVSYYYQYQAEYGSPRTDIQPHEISNLQVGDDGRKVTMDVAALKPGYIYQFDLRGVASADGEPISHPLICYTANRLRDGSRVQLPRPPPQGASEGTGKDKPPGARIRGVD